MKPYTMTGAVHKIGDTQTWSSGFSKRLLVLNTKEPDDKYDSFAAFDFVKSKAKDRTKMLDGVAVGDTVTVEFYVSASEYNGNWYSTNNAVKIENVSRKAPSKPVPPPAEPPADAGCGE